MLVKAKAYAGFLQGHLSAGPMGTANGDTDGSSEKKKAGEQRGSGTRDPRHPELLDVSSPALRDYQLDGYQWLVSLYENGLNGILADEMGALICCTFGEYLTP